MNKSKLTIRICALFLLMLMSSSLSLLAHDFTVVIDAGHGGRDCGAIGKIAKEKDITLTVAKLFGKKIEDECKDVKVVYTRETDKYLTLQQRANIANKANGDVFISIHVNSVDLNTPGRRKIAGASVFTLGLHRTDDNLSVAKRENSVIELEKDYTTTYSGFNPNSPESYIIFEINQNKHMMQSIDLASSIQNELINTAERNDKGVRQAGFWVLWATSMPSVLIELDFICNPKQEEFLASKMGQEKLAEAIFRAFKDYHSSISRQMSDINTYHTKSAEKNDEQQNQEKNELKTKGDYSKEDKIIYRVQVLSSKVKIDKNSKELKGLYPIWIYKENGLYKYTYESAATLNDAKKILCKVKKKFPQAFIVKFVNDKRVNN